MNQEIELNQSKKFPRGAVVIFAVVSFVLGVYAAFTVEAELGSDMIVGVSIFGGIGSLITGFIVAGVQYAFTMFPTQWISKEKNVYKYDIWSAIFYSSAITTVLNVLIQQFSFQENLIVSILFSVATTGLFLFFYFSGEEKERHVKKAMIIVQVVWLVLGLIIVIAGWMFVSSLEI
ncbi:hypothetical protein [Desemzia sp. FAM 23990]|uniref:hypothetical protein n=1 Tax=Desemzia sp. FAM 23990 TaxID=3259520 RepID=UPI0038872A8B